MHKSRSNPYIGTFENRVDNNNGGSSSAILAGLPLPQWTSPKTTFPKSRAATRKSALILRLLRQRARVGRNKKPQTFYSIRMVARHFGVPATTVSRIYSQLRSEGLLTSVWGSKTFVTPVKIHKQLRVRAVVALPASLTAFSTLRQYRNFFLEMRDALWNFGFATRLLFFGNNDPQLPSFAEFLLKYKPDIVIWFLPNPRLKETVARLLDRGTRVITVTDCPGDCGGHRYCIDRGPAIADALHSWQRNGIRLVTVLRDPCCGSVTTVSLIEKCLRDTAMPHAFANAQSWQSEDTLSAAAHQASRGIIFSSSELAVALAARDPARFAKLQAQARILLTDGPIDVPGSTDVDPFTDVVEVDLKLIAKQIAKNLIQPSRSRGAKAVTFPARWVPRAMSNGLNTRFRSTARDDAHAHLIDES